MIFNLSHCSWKTLEIPYSLLLLLKLLNEVWQPCKDANYFCELVNRFLSIQIEIRNLEKIA